MNWDKLREEYRGHRWEEVGINLVVWIMCYVIAVVFLAVCKKYKLQGGIEGLITLLIYFQYLSFYRPDYYTSGRIF
jgi:hypothetical protein